MGNSNRKCIICGKEYSYCPTCSSDRNKPSWYAICDSVNCVNINLIVSNYFGKALDKDGAKKALDKCDLSGRETLARHVQRALNEIYGPMSEKKDVDKNIQKNEVQADISAAVDYSKKARRPK